MDIQERLLQSEQQFNELSRQREEINTEMTKLQGEWRVLKELQATDAEKSKKPNKRATTIEAVPEGMVS